MTSTRFLGRAGLALLLIGLLVLPAQAQRVAKYGADFLGDGVGGRALGMGGAYVGLVNDVTAGYWNSAGLSALSYPEVAYMHAERFAGVVSFDYASAAFPVSSRSTIGISYFRSGVNDIKNTLDAWDPERDQPRPDAESRIRSFSAADAAFYVSYARNLNGPLNLGVTAKLIRRTIGDFADAWGYSFDVALQYRTERFVVGANVQDVSTMLQTWSINDASLSNLETIYDTTLPEGGTELVLPVARLGSGYILPMGLNSLTLGFDLDLAFDGTQAFAINTGDISYHPRVGAEFNVRDVVAFRAGISRVTNSERYGFDFTPTAGVGLRISQFAIDYGFGDFAGLTSDLGFSHRLSAQLTLEQPRMKRKEPEN
ncbi:MAG: PorV/PorQ family protein [Bacteroidota bacterium]